MKDIVIIEGPDGAGKTTVATALSHRLPLSFMLKMSGSPAYIKTPNYMRRIYKSLPVFFETIVYQHYLVLDRFSTSERVYSKFFKPYSPTYLDDYEEWLTSKFNIVQFYLDMPDELVETRLLLKTKMCPNENHGSVQFALLLRDKYREVIKHNTLYPTKTLDARLTIDELVHEILAELAIRFDTKESSYSM